MINLRHPSAKGENSHVFTYVIPSQFSTLQGFKEDLSKYSVVIHCGACMLNEKEVQSRVKECKKQHVPFTNYGIAIAKINGILDRSVEVF